MEESTVYPEWITNSGELERWLSGYEMGSFDPDNAVINRLAPAEEQDVFSRTINELSAIISPKGKTTAHISFEYITNSASEVSDFYKNLARRRNEFKIKAFSKDIILGESGECEFEPTDSKIKLIVKFKYESNKLIIIAKNARNMADYKRGEYFDMRIYEWLNSVFSLKIGLTCDDGFTILPSKITDISYHAKADVYCKPYNTGYVLKSSKEIEINSLQIYNELRYIPWMIRDNHLDFVNLGLSISDDKVLSSIEIVINEVKEHLSVIKSNYNGLAGANSQDELRSDLKSIEDEFNLASAGLKILRENKDALWSFKFLNEVMAAKPKIEKWRPFQIIFILIMISKYFNNRDKKSVILLNFPTGMGKTEAFMGYALWMSVYLRKTNTNYGNVAIIKYPRVMLSKQQASRAIELFSYANKCLLKTDLKKHPFSVGALYSKEDTPNRILDENNSFSAEFLKLEATTRGRGRAGFIFDRCPLCNGRVKTIASRERGRVLYVCKDENCEMSSNLWSSEFYREKGEIPIYTTDDEVFRYLPTIILTTTYKFAAFCTSGRWKTLLGVNSRILKSDSKFGCYIYDKDEEDVKNFTRQNNFTWLSGRSVNLPFVSPSLTIIDETHLISGSQASLLGPVETAFLDIFKNNNAFPQIVSSSATINKTLINDNERAFQQHMAQIFGCSLENIVVFPSSLEAYEDVLKRKQRTIAAFYPSKYTQLFCLEKVSSFIFSRVSRETNINYMVPVFYFSSKAEMSQAQKAIEGRVSRVVNLSFGGRFYTFSGDMDPGVVYAQLDTVARRDTWSSIMATNTIANGIDSYILNMMIFNGLPKSISEYVQARSRTGRSIENNALIVLILSRTNPREKTFHESFYEWHTNQEFLYDESPVNKYSEGVINDTIPRVFHLYAFCNKDGSRKSEMVYKRDVMEALIDEILAARGGELVEKITEWVVSPLDRARMNADIRGKVLNYLERYKDILRNRTEPTIYDFSERTPLYPNTCLPKISLLQVSDLVDVMLSNQSISVFQRAMA